VVDGATTDLAAMSNAVVDRVPEVKPDEDA
jgi:hypothetical protein